MQSTEPPRARAAHRLARASGARPAGGRLPLRAARAAARRVARRRARRGQRPAQPGRRRPQRACGRRRWSRAASAPLGLGHAGRREGGGRRDRAPAHRSRHQRRRLPRRAQEGRVLGVRRRRRLRDLVPRPRSRGQGGARLRLGGSRPASVGGAHLRRPRGDPHRGAGREPQRERGGGGRALRAPPPPRRVGARRRRAATGPSRPDGGRGRQGRR